MKFWRFNIESMAAVEDSIASRSIVLPTRLHPEAKNIPSEVVARKIKIGDGVLLADFLNPEGVVHAIGIVRSLPGEFGNIEVDWVRTTTRLPINPQGGFAQWQKEACFKFAEDPASRYNLAGLFRHHFGTNA